MNLLTLLVGFLFSFGLQAKVVIFTDVDDTIKQTNVLSKAAAISSTFTSKTKAFPHMKTLFEEIKAHHANEVVEIYYVSGSVKCITNQKKWLEKNGFMPGTLFQRQCKKGEDAYPKPTKEYKVGVIARTLRSLNKGEHHVYLFGDNGQHDAEVYAEVQEILPHFNYHPFVRDIATKSFPFDERLSVIKVAKVNYFLTEIELINSPDFDFLTDDYKALVAKDLKEDKLMASYLDETLAKRFEKEANLCKKDAKAAAMIALRSFYGEVE